MENNNRKQKDTNVNRLRRRARFSFLLVIVGAAALIVTILDAATTSFHEYSWSLLIRGVTTTAAFAMSLLILHVETRYRGHYRCKACGHIYEPDEEELAATIMDNRTPLVCPHCAAHNRQKKLSKKALAKLAVM